MLRHLITVSVLLALASTAFADPLQPGDKAPTISGVKVTTGETVSGKEVAGDKATVYLFTCTHCPIAGAYEERFIAFANKYESKGVKLVAINCNGEERKTLTDWAKEKKPPFVYLADDSQNSATGFGATRTPELFVVNGEGEVVYTGAFDSDLRDPKTHYVADAVEAVLAGKTPETQTTRAFGCGIPKKRE